MNESWWTKDALSAQHVENGVCSSTDRFLCVHCTKVYNRVGEAVTAPEASETMFQAGDQFVDTLWAEEISGQIITVEIKPYSVLYEVKWADGEITYERYDYLRQLEKI